MNVFGQTLWMAVVKFTWHSFALFLKLKQIQLSPSFLSRVHTKLPGQGWAMRSVWGQSYRLPLSLYYLWRLQGKPCDHMASAFAVSLFWSRCLLFSRDSSGGQSRRISIQLTPVSTRANVLLTKWPGTSARNVASRSALQWEWQQTVSGLSNRIFDSCLYSFYVTFAFLLFFNWKKRILTFIYKNNAIYKESAELVTKSTKKSWI